MTHASIVFTCRCTCRLCVSFVSCGIWLRWIVYEDLHVLACDYGKVSPLGSAEQLWNRVEILHLWKQCMPLEERGLFCVHCHMKNKPSGSAEGCVFQSREETKNRVLALISEVLQIKARELRGDWGISGSQFKASRGCAQKFLKSTSFPTRMQTLSFLKPWWQLHLRNAAFLTRWMTPRTVNLWSETAAKKTQMYQKMVAGDCWGCCRYQYMRLLYLFENGILNTFFRSFLCLILVWKHFLFLGPSTSSLLIITAAF